MELEWYVFYYDGFIDERKVEILKSKREAKKFIKQERLKNRNKRSDYQIVNFGKILPREMY